MTARGGRVGARLRVPLVALAILVATLALFQPLCRHPFLSLDDTDYVVENAQVQRGLSWDGCAWAFTTYRCGNWHPLTWLSHMLDVELFGMDPGRHHLVSVVLHGTNAALLFLCLEALTGALWPSAFAAALFAGHPLHVESVAWVAERKDVLSGLLWLLAMAAYLRYVRRPGPARYALVGAVFALALMAKPIVVTLPLVLLLLDWWPLGRWAPGGKKRFSVARLASLCLEKVPLLALAAVSSAITVMAQSSGGAIATLGKIPLSLRLSNAAVAYLQYLRKSLWPAGLSIFYPFPESGIPLLMVSGSVLLLVGVTVLVLLAARRRPSLPTGWFWYLGTLVPVIGAVQVGSQGMADRYTYLPLTGLFIMAAWGIRAPARGAPQRWGVLAMAVVVPVLLSAAARRQIDLWRGGEVLYRHAIEVDPRNWLAREALGTTLAEEGRSAEALEQLEEAVRTRPAYYLARGNLGNLLLMLGRTEEAVAQLRAAVSLKPDYYQGVNGLGVGLCLLGRFPEGVEKFRRALEINPDAAEAHLNLGKALEKTGDRRGAIGAYRRALELDPGSEKARRALERVVVPGSGRGAD